MCAPTSLPAPEPGRPRGDKPAARQSRWKTAHGGTEMATTFMPAAGAVVAASPSGPDLQLTGSRMSSSALSESWMVMELEYRQVTSPVILLSVVERSYLALGEENRVQPSAASELPSPGSAAAGDPDRLSSPIFSELLPRVAGEEPLQPGVSADDGDMSPAAPGEVDVGAAPGRQREPAHPRSPESWTVVEPEFRFRAPCQGRRRAADPSGGRRGSGPSTGVHEDPYLPCWGGHRRCNEVPDGGHRRCNGGPAGAYRRCSRAPTGVHRWGNAVPDLDHRGCSYVPDRDHRMCYGPPAPILRGQGAPIPWPGHLRPSSLVGRLPLCLPLRSWWLNHAGRPPERLGLRVMVHRSWQAT
ncbi:uncharacterized protein KZ484_026957 [Pholidichthys leucotaenia]